MADHAERRARLRTAIVRYLRKRPLAGDTPEGIVPCWLPRRGYEDAPLYIKEVLEAMVVAGELAVQRLPDGGVLYVRGRALPGCRDHGLTAAVDGATTERKPWRS